MYAILLRKIESYLDELYQFAGEIDSCYLPPETILLMEDSIKQCLESYPEIVLDIFNDIVTLKEDMIQNSDGSMIYDIEECVEELICLLKEYECIPSELNADVFCENLFTFTNSQDETFEYDECLDELFVSESKLRLAADTERSNAIYQFICQEQKLVPREKIIRQFPGTTLRALNMVLSRDDILSYDSLYIAAKVLQIRYSAKAKILETASHIVRDMSQHNISELLEIAQKCNEDFLSDAMISTSHQLFSAMAYFFGESFTFARPYFAAKGVRIYTADDQIKNYIRTTKNYSIRSMLDYTKSKRITVDNILRILSTLNDEYYILDKETIIPIINLGISRETKYQIIQVISKELTSARCIAIRDMESFSSLPPINVRWTEWLLYSIVKQMKISSISALVSSNRFNEAIPILAVVGEDNSENIKKASFKHINTSSVSNGVDNLENLDLLLGDIIDYDFLEDSL